MFGEVIDFVRTNERTNERTLVLNAKSELRSSSRVDVLVAR